MSKPAYVTKETADASFEAIRRLGEQLELVVRASTLGSIGTADSNSKAIRLMKRRLGRLLDQIVAFNKAGSALADSYPDATEEIYGLVNQGLELAAAVARVHILLTRHMLEREIKTAVGRRIGTLERAQRTRRVRDDEALCAELDQYREEHPRVSLTRARHTVGARQDPPVSGETVRQAQLRAKKSAGR